RLFVCRVQIVKDVQSGKAKLILNGLVGKQGPKPSENPYWRLVYEDVLQQPAPDDQMRAAGLPGRVFPAFGNHEVWDDSDKEEYNYLLVDVQPGQQTKFTLNRFRPWAAKPFESVELFGPSSTGGRALQ